MTRAFLVGAGALAIAAFGASVEAVPTNDADEIRPPLPFFYDLYTFRGDGGTTTVVASFAVRAGRLERERVDGSSRYRFNVSFVLADTARGHVARSDDSVFVAVGRALDDDHFIHTHVETAAPPSTTTVQRVVMIDAPRPGTGQLYTHAFVVPDYRGDRLMLSDIALGLPDRPGGWRRGDATLALLPSSHFPTGPFDVYYEVYNLPEGNDFTTEFAFEPLDDPGDRGGRDDRTIRVSFSGESSAGDDDTLREFRHVDPSLAPGRYWMMVTVTDRTTGRTARRGKVLQVREWREDATMVPACPVAPGVVRPDCRGTSPTSASDETRLPPT